ncbi:MAG: amino acid racemase [Gammaproteobacteria bacterium]|nr:amino acid racemase [Gammaproteobacteria bacterium]MBV9622156.1 amino acid racemase [Gammaproteobacteria bacterium]
MLHIGIVGCSAEGAALCYRTVCLEAEPWLGLHAHPEVTLHTHALARYVPLLDAADWPGVAALMLDSAQRLARAGADFLICPDNTIHAAMPYLRARTPRPWLHIAEVVALQARARGYHRLGITGTRYLTDSEVYPQALEAQGIEFVRPSPAARAEINRIIFEELVRGQQRPEAVRYFQEVFTALQREGCDAVVLGCTEVPLIMHDGNSPLPTLDSTRLLARAALRRAIGL